MSTTEETVNGDIHVQHKEQLIREALEQGVVMVSFYKLNGDLRDMYCTTDNEIIPQDQIPKSSKPKDGVIAAYDVVAMGWRSFRVENVILWQENA